ncbi:hypothetical protein XH90_06455 [Bradyrhizobium sp. CCBAU 53338]|nr:hypothetical protein XH90_06455 [Bradyrhizobium sp. CCBAU 53338]
MDEGAMPGGEEQPATKWRASVPQSGMPLASVRMVQDVAAIGSFCRGTFAGVTDLPSEIETTP